MVLLALACTDGPPDGESGAEASTDGSESGNGDGEPGDGDGEPGDGDGEPGDGDGEPGDGDGEPGDGDGEVVCDPPLTACNGACVDLMSDSDNCGECGNACEIMGDLGECKYGGCGNILSACQDANTEPLLPCTEVCQNQGLTCEQQECGGLTLYWYSTLEACEGVVDDAGGSNLACIVPNYPTNNYYRCCCAQD
ncbi:MAG TPA: hypothetical protein VK034_30840 [Enhygromyxa sp.]|nr:hypothetical protein [Enhygromyxa sp.]